MSTTASTAECTDDNMILPVADNDSIKQEKKAINRRRRVNPEEKLKPGRKSIEELREKFAKVLIDVWQDIRDLKVIFNSLNY